MAIGAMQIVYVFERETKSVVYDRMKSRMNSLKT